jgi:hypothetical protein
MAYGHVVAITVIESPSSNNAACPDHVFLSVYILFFTAIIKLSLHGFNRVLFHPVPYYEILCGVEKAP